MGSMALDLGQLLDGLTFVASGDPLPARVAEIRSHSAQVEPGDLFVAVPGRRHDGAAFAGEALRRGARVVVAEQAPALPLPPGVTWLRVPSARRALSRLAANRYGHPSRRLVVVGVTGTTGKTTTTLLLHHLLTAAGIATGVMGSLVVDTGRRRRPGHLTTPDPLDLHRHLREMVDDGCRAAVMEVSSQGADQGRVDDVAFDLGVVTNLAPLEHLEYHPTYEHYAAAKGRFVAMVPADGGLLMHAGEAALRLGRFARAPVVPFGRGPEGALRLLAEAMVPLADPGGHGAGVCRDGTLPRRDGTLFHGAQGPAPAPLPWTNRLWLELPSGWPSSVRRRAADLAPPAGRVRPEEGAALRRLAVDTQLLGSHHALNVVAAVGAALWLGLSPQQVAQAVPRFRPPRRRTEVILREPFTVIDDTAGRPDSLAACFGVASRLPHRRLVAVYAVRGGRGEAINYANGLQLACEARRAGAVVVVTASHGDTAPRDAVQPGEWEACLAGLAAGGLEPPQVLTFARLPDAVAAAVARLGAGDLLLLLGAQGMDAGAAYLRAILAEGRGADGRRHGPDAAAALDGSVAEAVPPAAGRRVVPGGAAGPARGAVTMPARQALARAPGGDRP